MAWVYILQSLCDKRFYIGSTSNLEQRLNHHFGNSTPSTKRFGGLKLVLSRVIEKKLKNLRRHDYIEKMVSDGYIKMKI